MPNGRELNFFALSPYAAILIKVFYFWRQLLLTVSASVYIRVTGEKPLATDHRVYFY